MDANKRKLSKWPVEANKRNIIQRQTGMHLPLPYTHKNTVLTLCPSKCVDTLSVLSVDTLSVFTKFAKNVLFTSAPILYTKKNTASRENSDFAFCTPQGLKGVRPFRLVESGRTFF
jgi:hypothetical protein